MAETWDLPEDSRKNGMEYPFYSLKKSPSGNGFVIDDTKGHESMTFFHRSGSLIQFKEDGSLVVINKKNAYQMVFGDNNVLVTGAQNVTINGGGSLKVEGDYDMTVNGNMRTTVQGDHEMTVAGNATQVVKGNSEVVVGENQSIKVAGNAELLAKKQIIASDSDLRIAASGEVSTLADTINNQADSEIINTADDISNESATLTHNGTNVGDTHTHLGVMSGGDVSDVPQ